MKLYESVPNFSEGRDQKTIDALASAARSVGGVSLLDVEHNADHNRSVFSLAGEAVPLTEALARMVRVAVERIDLNHHRGEHPRMGAVDVVPFVPLGDSTVPEALALAIGFGERVWKEFHIPVYFYGQAARSPERADLAVVRKGEFEGIRDAIRTDPSRRPDIGAAEVHPTAGAMAVGVRPVLIAYNVYLKTADQSVAKRIAHAVRARDGGLPEVKALGFAIAERNEAQVSMNLTDFHTTPIHQAFEAVRREAARSGTEVDESEIVGLVPLDALVDAAAFYLELKHFDRATILERQLEAAARRSPEAATASLADLSVTAFSERLAARTPTPGGGSAAAVAGALGSALGEMVIAYSQPKVGEVPELTEVANLLRTGRLEFLEDVDADARAYDGVRAARSQMKANTDDLDRRRAWVTAVRGAIAVPLGVARRATGLHAALARVGPQTKELLRSDFLSALALFTAAETGGLANAEVNIGDLEGAGEDASGIRAEIARLRASELE